MKKAIFLFKLIIIITISCNAQYSNYSNKKFEFKDIAIQTSILTTTFVTTELMINKEVKSSTIITTIIIGTTSTIISHYVVKNIKKNKPANTRKKRINKLSRL